MAHIGILENTEPHSMIPELEPVVSYHSDIIPCKGEVLLLGKGENYEVSQVIINPNNQMGLSTHPQLDILVVCQKCQSGLDLQRYFYF